MDNKPKLRPIEAFPVEQDGKTLVYLKDPLNLATPIGISPVGYFILSHFDGRHSHIDIQSAYARQFGGVLRSAELQSFVDMLDQHHYLDTERFESYREQVTLEFRRLPERLPAHVGGVYKADAAELWTAIFPRPTGRDYRRRTLGEPRRKRSSRRTSIFTAVARHTRGRTSRWPKVRERIFISCSALHTAVDRRHIF
jgi:hypothetical protein